MTLNSESDENFQYFVIASESVCSITALSEEKIKYAKSLFLCAMELDEFCYNRNSLDQLPFELLEIIFQFLEIEDLKRLLQLGERVRDVLISSPVSMRKLRLFLNENWMEQVSFLKESGDCIKDLDFDFCNFEQPVEFRDLMKLTRNIERLRLSNVHIAAENFNKKFKVLAMKFHKLNALDVDNSQAMGKLVRLYLKKVQVKQLRLDFCHYNVAQEFVELLWNQKTLTTLELSGFNNILYQSLFKHDISYTIGFELKRLILNHRVTSNELYLKFLRVLTALECLEVYKEVEVQDFFNIIFAMERLKSMTLATNFVTLKNIDFKKAANSKIQELVLVTRSQYGIEQTINYLVTKLLSLKTLKIINMKTDSSDQLLGFVHLRKLENLHIENSKLKFIQSIKFDHLKSISLSNVHPFLKFEDWEHFFQNNRKIERIVLSQFEVYYVIESIKAEIEKFVKNIHYIEKSLKHFEIYQELRYQKPIKLYIDISEKRKIMKVSDSFIKICRSEFHYLRKLAPFNLSYYADDYFDLNNKYLK